MKKKDMDFYFLITKYRLQIFGISLLWIFFRHTFFYNQFNFGIFQPLCEVGDAGVDIFLFLSGFGLYFSYPKYTLKSFYARRILRIIPTFILLALLFTFLDNCNNLTLFSKLVFSPKNWFHLFYSQYWFIAAIIMFYIVFPFLLKCVLKYNYLFVIFSYLITLILLFAISEIHFSFVKQLNVYIARFPIFIIGILYANKLFLFSKSKWAVAFFLISIPLLVYSPKDYQRLFYSLSTIGIITALPYIFDFIPVGINKILGFIGTISLEFYMIHVFLFSNNCLGIVDNYIHSEIVTVIMLLIATSILAFICNFCINKFTLFFLNK